MTELAGADTRTLYTGLVGLVAVQRLVELRVSRGNERRLRLRGAEEAGAGHYPWMVALHTVFLASCVAEVHLLDRPFVAPLAGIALTGLVAATTLRWWTLRTLGGRWTTRVLVLPGESPVTGGPFRHLRHPNYLAVVLEMAALPLVHAAWGTALLFSAANALLLRVRIRAEEAAWRAAGSGERGYAGAFAGRGGLLPGRGRKPARSPEGTEGRDASGRSGEGGGDG